MTPPLLRRSRAQSTVRRPSAIKRGPPAIASLTPLTTPSPLSLAPPEAPHATTRLAVEPPEHASALLELVGVEVAAVIRHTPPLPFPYLSVAVANLHYTPRSLPLCRRALCPGNAGRDRRSCHTVAEAEPSTSPSPRATPARPRPPGVSHEQPPSIHALTGPPDPTQGENRLPRRRQTGGRRPFQVVGATTSAGRWI